MKRIARGTLLTITLLAWLWCLGALWYTRLPSEILRWVLLVAFVAPGPVAWSLKQRELALYRAIAIPVGLVIIGWFLIPASNERPWWDEQARHATGRIEQGFLHLEAYREVRGEDDAPRYGSRDLELSRLTRLWFGMQTFPGWEGGAHTFLSFEVQDEPSLTVSVESRRLPEEPFSAVQGLFKSYELVYVIGDEDELVGRRSGTGAELRLYPVRADHDAQVALLTSIVERSTALEARPEHYNTLTNNCTTNLADHVHAIAPQALPFWDLRIILPGYSDRLLLELGLLDTDLPIDEARRRFTLVDGQRRP